MVDEKRKVKNDNRIIKSKDMRKEFGIEVYLSEEKKWKDERIKKRKKMWMVEIGWDMKSKKMDGKRNRNDRDVRCWKGEIEEKRKKRMRSKIKNREDREKKIM